MPINPSLSSVSVIIPMHNAEVYLRKCLYSIQQQKNNDFETIIVDDDSSDQSSSIAKDMGFTNLIFKKGEGHNPAKARNYGAKHACGDILVFVDADIVLNRDSITNIVESLIDKNVDVLSGNYTGPIPDANYFGQLQNFILEYRLSYRPQKIIPYLSSAFFAIKRQAYEAVGGFNETMPYFEDVELEHRLIERGFKISFDPHIIVSHIKYYNHWLLLYDYWKKTVISGAYLRMNTSRKNQHNDRLKFDTRLSGLLTVPLFLSTFFIPKNLLPFYFLLFLYSFSMLPFLLFLSRSRNIYFAFSSYFVCYEIFFVSFVGIIYGFIKGEYD